MSTWKSSKVTITQIILYGDGYAVIGMGSDQKLYQWDEVEGAWEKFYNEKDKPELE